MKTKVIIVIIFLISFSQNSLAQDWKLWYTNNDVSLYYAFMPEKSLEYGYYLIKVSNRSTSRKWFSAKFDFLDSRKRVITDRKPWHIYLNGGQSYITKRFQYIVTRDLQNKTNALVPQFHYSELRIENP